MNVIGHQAVAENVHAELLGLLTQVPQIKRAVAVIEEDIAPPHPALRDMMSITGQYNARQSWHGAKCNRSVTGN